jgi:hypothetical protein
MSGAERMRKFREQRRGDGFRTLERAWSRATVEGRARFVELLCSRQML